MLGSRSIRGRGPLLVLLVPLVLAVGVGSAFAAFPNPGDGKYYACLVKQTGAVRLINYPKVNTCPKGQKLISWNQAGPAGPVGARGPQGPVGPAGITKIALTTVYKTESPVGPQGTVGSAIATCAPGSKVVGGGFSQANATAKTFQSRPEGVDAWAVWWAKGEAGDHPVTAYAICMTTDPSAVIAKVAKKKGR